MMDLMEAARAARDRAYAPYSRFRVGAALRGSRGGVHAGSNVENASYPEGQCAETSAIGAMIAAGERCITEIVVMGTGDPLCTPCGGCRQRLSEFAAADVPVHICGDEGLRRTVTLGDLLPLSFGSAHLDGVVEAMENPVDVVRARVQDFTPEVGLILGSGLGGFADAIEDAVAIAYEDLPGFPRPGVEGHAGRLVLGRIEGVAVACLQGRVHLYEGTHPSAVNVLVRTLEGLGCTTLVLTNASGSLRTDIGPGSVVLIEDHINMLGANPLVGPNDEADGPRFPDMSVVYDRDLRDRLRAAAEKAGVALPSGVYLATLGPSFETPAEIRAFRALGADLVGMSTVPEAISARHAGLRVAALSVVTNLAAGMTDEPLSHAETLEQASAAAGKLSRILPVFFKDLKRGQV